MPDRRIYQTNQTSCLVRLTPFDTTWNKGSGATPLTIQDLYYWDAISIPTAPTNHLPDGWTLNENTRGQKGAD